MYPIGSGLWRTDHERHRLRLPLAAICVTSVLVSAQVVELPKAGAAPLTVTNCNGSGAGSLSAVVAGAASGSKVTFSVTCPSTSPITPASTIYLKVPLTIDGPGTSSLVVDGSFVTDPKVTGISVSGLEIDGTEGGFTNQGTAALSNCAVNNGGPSVANYGTLTVSDCSMSEGHTGGPGGGALYNDGDLNISSSSFTENTAASGPNGGAIDSGGGSVTITDSTISDNQVGDGTGGGIQNDAGTMNITDSTISDNNSLDAGGGIFNAGTMSVTGSTIAHNAAVGGGGIDNTGSLTVTDSTISGNNAEAPDNQSGPGSGGILNTGRLLVIASTIAQNIHGGGIENNGGTATLAATVLASMSPFYDCTGAIVDEGFNIDDDGTCDFSAAAHSYSDGKPHIGPLQDNGGPTETQEPALGSLPLDEIPAGTATGGVTLCPGTDQRGIARPQGNGCDIGAVELSPTAQDITSPSQATVTAKQPFSFTVTTTGTPAARISEIGKPPSKLTFVDNGDGTATIAGKAKDVGSSNLVIKAVFGKGHAKYVVFQVLALDVVGPP